MEQLRRVPDGTGTWTLPSAFNAMTPSGISVSPNKAMQLSAVFGGVRAIAETISTLPLHVYRATEFANRTGRQVDRSHWAYRLLHDRPNPEITKVEFFEYLVAHLELRGNAYAEIVRNRRGEVVDLWPLHPDYTKAKRDNGGAIYYEVRPPGQESVRLRERDMLHIRFMPIDGLQGISPIRAGAMAIAQGLANQEWLQNLYGGGGVERTALETDADLSPEDAKALLQSWEETYGRMNNSGRVAILHNGLHTAKVGISPKDAQALEMTNASIYDIARILRIPPTKLQNHERSTFSNVEQLNIDWATDSILPRCARIEAAINRAVLQNNPKVFVRFNVDGLLRGDIATRMQAHSIAIQWGIKSPNEVREDEDMNPYEGGDKYYQAVNLTPANDDGGDENGPETDTA